jgi:hypothetical protein
LEDIPANIPAPSINPKSDEIEFEWYRSPSHLISLNFGGDWGDGKIVGQIKGESIILDYSPSVLISILERWSH